MIIISRRTERDPFHDRIGWLRAAVLGANDGVLSTASDIVGVAAANPAPRAVLTAALRRLLLALCRWRRASTSRSARRQTPSPPVDSRKLLTLLYYATTAATTFAARLGKPGAGPFTDHRERASA